MKDETGSRKVILSSFILFSCAVIIIGAFMYGRIIGRQYRSSIEIAVSSFIDDIEVWSDAAKEYISNVLNLVENPR